MLMPSLCPLADPPVVCPLRSSLAMVSCASVSVSGICPRRVNRSPSCVSQT